MFKIILISVVIFMCSITIDFSLLSKNNGYFIKNIKHNKIDEIKKDFYDEVWYKYDSKIDLMDDYNQVFLINQEELLYDTEEFMDYHKLPYISLFTRKNDILYSRNKLYFQYHDYIYNKDELDNNISITKKVHNNKIYHYSIISHHLNNEDLDVFFETVVISNIDDLKHINILYIFFNKLLFIVMIIYLLIIISKKEKKINFLYDVTNFSNSKKSYKGLEYITNVSHELRTPLNSIIGFADFIYQNLDVTNDVKECAKDIFESGEHLLSMINNMIDFYKINNSKIIDNFEIFDVNKLIQQCINILLLPDSKFKINFRTPKSSIYLNLNKTRLKQVFINILSNAIRFIDTQKGIINIYISFNNDNTRVIIKIIDNGIGIKENDISKVMDLFGKVDYEYNTTHNKGLGIGLPLSKNIIELMNGDLNIDSSYGIGTSVIIELPYNQEDYDVCLSANN